MRTSSVRALVLLTALAVLAWAAPASAAGRGHGSAGAVPSVDLSELLEPVAPAPPTTRGFLRVRDVLEMTFEEAAIYYMGFGFSVSLLDGGPNIDKNDFLSNSYTDSHKKAGVGGLVYVQMRMSPNICLRMDLGAQSFGSNGQIMDNLGRKYSIDPLTAVYANLGGSFYYPVLMLGEEPDKASDLEGFQIYARAAVGLRVLMQADAQMDYDPLGGYAPEEKFAFWHESVGFSFNLAVGFEFRVDMFCAFVEFGLITFEGPKPATHPRDYSNGEMLLAYPVSAGFGMRL